MSEQLSERGKDLVKYMPQAVNALADRLIEKLEERVLYGEKPQTNADRIRAMTDEELAKWIVFRTEGIGFDGFEDFEKGWLKWLKEEAKDERI